MHRKTRKNPPIRKKLAPEDEQLARRSNEIFGFLLQGMSATQISKKFKISRATVHSDSVLLRKSVSEGTREHMSLTKNQMAVLGVLMFGKYKTMEDVARIAGTTKQTVSKIINDPRFKNLRKGWDSIEEEQERRIVAILLFGKNWNTIVDVAKIAGTKRWAVEKMLKDPRFQDLKNGMDWWMENRVSNTSLTGRKNPSRARSDTLVMDEVVSGKSKTMQEVADATGLSWQTVRRSVKRQSLKEYLAKKRKLSK